MKEETSVIALGDRGMTYAENRYFFHVSYEE